MFTFIEKSLKIPKRQSESVYRRRTDNTMAKRKSTKGQTTIYKTIQKKIQTILDFSNLIRNKAYIQTWSQLEFQNRRLLHDLHAPRLFSFGC
jgi:hypothetical protein